MPSRKSPRLFIGTPCPPEVGNCLRENIRILKRDGGHPTINWTKPAQWHLTLRFLGPVKEPIIPDLCQGLQTVAEEHSCMNLHLHQPGSFPAWHRARVFWIGLDGDLDALHRLQEAIETAVRDVDIPADDRTYVPHLTVARIRTPSRRIGTRFQDVAEKLEWNACWRVGGFELIESRLESEGPVYRTVRSFQLD